MPHAFVFFAFILFYSCFHLLPVAVSPSATGKSPWFAGCVDGSSGLLALERARDLDPVTCCERCLDEGFPFAGLSSDGCFCGNWHHELLVSECVNSSYSGETKEVQGGRRRQSVVSLPVGGGEGSIALYRTEGPFLHSVGLSVLSDRVQAGKTFILEVSGKLAGCPEQPTGLFGVEWQEFSSVSIEFETPSPTGHSLHRARVFDDGSFSWSADWIYETPGQYSLTVRVSNPLSICSSTLHVFVTPPSSSNLVISLLHGSLGVPSCTPSLQTDSHSVMVEAVYLDDPVTLQAHLVDGLRAEFMWSVTHQENNMEVKTGGVNSTVNLTFETEGVYTVSVNASSAFGWTQETKHVVVCPVISDLKENEPENLLTSTKGLSGAHKNWRVYAEGNRKSSSQITINPTGQPPTSQSLVHSPAHVQIYAANQTYPTNTGITLLAVAQTPDPVEFVWHFGDSRSVRTTSRTITKRYQKPGRYDVVVVMFSSQGSVSSGAFPLTVQRAVKLNRLLHPPSVLQNQTVKMSCLVNVGTDPIFLWSFGDGSFRMGQGIEQHIYQRTGEFTVKVTVSNLVSSASLSSRIFVVDRPCQPPPVKNMGPLQLQVQRSEVVHLGVTYDTEGDCDISGGLHYSWTLFDSEGRTFPLPLIDTQKQSLILPGHLLYYDTYTAIARVQVIGSVVYSNYSVRVQVIPSSPVAFIRGGTNVFINSRYTDVITFDGQKSYDPDFPTDPVSFSWTCQPVSSITSSCFQHEVPTSSPLLSFPVSFLKTNFDQFQFTLTVHSGERSASSETFITLTPNVIRKVSVYCSHCEGDHLNWDQSFSVSAMCEGCDISSEYVWYSWSLFLVNASSKPVIEVPFCYTLDLGTPSTVFEGSTLYSPVKDASVSAFEMRARQLNMSLTDSSMLSKNNREEPGEEPFYHPVREPDPPEPLSSSTEYQTLALDNSSVQYLDHLGQSDVISEMQIDPDSSTDWELYFPVLESGDLGGRLDYDVPSMNPEGGDPGTSAGRPSDVDGETFSPGDDSVFSPALHEDEGDNLVDDRPLVAVQDPVLLDLPRDPVDRDVFESYTYTGISSPLLSFRPFSLRPGSRYMLEVIAQTPDSFLGRTQLFLKTSPAPKGMTCQVQPTKGKELYTHFGIFCTSGREDLVYEYSLSVGDRAPRTLYHGRDFQYYFSLPSGDPGDDYKVTIYTVIRSSTGGPATKPCPVNVQVQPSFYRGNASSLPFDPDLEFSETCLRNLSALVQLGNSKEIQNHISLLTNILNRLSQDAEANIHAQRRTRSLLICALCELESSEEAAMVDNICILKSLVRFTHQVSLTSARRVIHHVQAISERLSKSRAPGWYHLAQETLDTLVALLSYSLQAAVYGNNFPSEKCNHGDTNQALGSDSHDESIRNALFNACIAHPSTGDYNEKPGSILSRQAIQLVAEILQTAAELMMRYILFHEAREHRVSTGFIVLYARNQTQTSKVISSSSSTVYLPSSLIQRLFVHSRETGRPCVLSMLTELTHSPYTWAHHPGKLSGPVVDLSLYRCNSKRKMRFHSLIQPINIELQLPQRTKNYVSEHILLRSQINYHSFNITQEHLQQVIQLSVAFTPSLNKAFPIMLLFRMFEWPTPSMHHLLKIHHWESNAIHMTLPPSYLKAAGVGHLALLNADFQNAARHKHTSEWVSYSVTVESSLCLSWDDHKGAWTQHGCMTQQVVGTTAAVNCSCQQLRPVTVVQEQIQSSHDTGSLDQFVSVTTDLTVLCVLVLCVCLFIPAMVMCKRADVVSEANQGVHYLSDNSPSDPYLYTVTVHTGPCSAAYMSAKVYIMLNGEDGVSQTKELQVQGCRLFRRNSQDTFILSAAVSLGQVRGVHIWHDNSGRSPSWFLKQVEVSEVNRGKVGGRTWLFVCECWLAVNKGDGQVERRLQVCNQGISFAKMLGLKLSDYFADYHMWISIYSCPSPNSFTCAQRLSVSLLLLMGYSCVNTIIISQMDDQLLLEVGIIGVSAASVTAGLLSVVAVLPAGALLSFLFRLRDVEMAGSEVQYMKDTTSEKIFHGDALSVTDSVFEPHLFWSSLQRCTREVWRSKHQGPDQPSLSPTMVENKNTDKEPAIQSDMSLRKDYTFLHETVELPLQNFSPVNERNRTGQALQGKELNLFSGLHETQKAPLSCLSDQGEVIHSQGKEEGSHYQVSQSSTCHYITDRLKRRGFRPVSQWSQYLAWPLCLLLSFCCLVLSAVVGMRFSSSQVLLWMYSLFFSLVSCIFLIQPAVIITAAVAVSLCHRNRADFHSLSQVTEKNREVSKLWSLVAANQPDDQFLKTVFLERRCSNVNKLLGSRRRARFLRHTRPPTREELRKDCWKKRREALICKTLRDFSICFFMLFLMLCINYGGSLTADYYRLNKAVREKFVRGRDNSFMSIQKYDDWWDWTRTSLLPLLYNNASTTTEQPQILIGEPILWKVEESKATLVPECHLYMSRSSESTHPHCSIFGPLASPPRKCGQPVCNTGQSTSVGLSHRKSEAESRLRLLRLGNWLDRRTAAVKVHLTLFSPAANLFTGVTMLTQQSPIGVLLPSARVQSLRVYHTPAVWDYVVMVCQLLFLFLSLLQLYAQVFTVGEQGLIGYWRMPCNWLEVSLLIVTIVYYTYHIHHSGIALDVVKLLQRHDYRENIDVDLLATCEQTIRSLHGLLLFLLSLKCVTGLMAIRMFATCAALLTHTLSRLFWPMISVLILMVALSCVGILRLDKIPLASGLLSPSILTLLCHYHSQKAAKDLPLSGWDLLYRGLLFLFSIVWTARTLGVVSSLVKCAKASQSRNNVFTMTELINFIRQRVSEFIGHAQGGASAENQMERRMYHFEEFENVLDELLFKLNTLSDSLHHTLPPKAHRYKDSTQSSPIQEPLYMDIQDSMGQTKCSMLNDYTDVHSHRTALPSHLLRSKPEPKQQRSQGEDSLFPSIVKPATETEENPKDRQLQSFLKAKNSGSSFNLASVVTVCPDNVPEKLTDQRTEKDGCRWLSKTQTNHTEVLVVEVLVHGEPGNLLI